MAQREVARFDGRCKVLFIGTGQQSRKDLLPLLARHIPLFSPVDLTSAPSVVELTKALDGNDPAFCFLHIDNSGLNLLERIPDLLQIAPKLGIVAILPPNEPDLILRSLRKGCSDFLMPPFTAEQLEAVLHKLLRQLPTTQASRGSVYCAIPVKGASGATTIACALAYALKAAHSKRVLLADLDPLTGIIGFLLKLKSQFSFADVLLRASDMDDDLWKAMVTSRDGVEILLAPEMPPTGLELNDAQPILEYARFHYNSVIADLGSPYPDWTLSVAAASDEVLLVTSNEIFQVQAAQRVIAHLESNGVGRQKMRILINRYDPHVGLSQEVLRDALGMDITQFLPSDYDSLQQSLLDDKLISPSSRFGKAITALAARLEGPVIPTRKAASLTGLLSLFSRLST